MLAQHTKNRACLTTRELDGLTPTNVTTVEIDEELRGVRRGIRRDRKSIKAPITVTGLGTELAIGGPTGDDPGILIGFKHDSLLTR